MAIKKIVPVAIGGNAGAALKAHLEAIERLTEEKKMIQSDITDHFTIAKTEGFDPKIMRIILKRRAMDAAARAEQDALVATYSRAIGTPSLVDADDVHGDDEDDAA